MGYEDDEVRAAAEALGVPVELYRREALLAFARGVGAEVSTQEWGPPRGRVPFVPQGAPGECGAACLAMVLGAHGRDVSLAEVLAEVGPDASAPRLLAAARAFGLETQAMRVEAPAALKELPAGTILHWRFVHWVVLEQGGRRGAYLLDPARGRRLVRWPELGRLFTGIALVFEASENLDTLAHAVQPSRRTPWWRGAPAAAALFGLAATGRLGLALSAPWVAFQVWAGWGGLLATLAALVGWVALGEVGRLAEQVARAKAGERASHNASLRWLENPPDAPRSHLLARLNTIWELGEEAPRGGAWPRVQALSAASCVAGLSALSPYLAGLTAVGLALQILGEFTLGRWARQSAQNAREATDAAQVHLVRRLGARQALWTQATGRAVITRSAALHVAARAAQVRRARWAALHRLWRLSCLAATPVTVAFVGLFRLAIGSFDLPTLLAAVLWSTWAAVALGPALTAWRERWREQRAEATTDILPEAPPDPRPRAPRLTGTIEFHQVQSSPGELTFTAPAGQITALWVRDEAPVGDVARWLLGFAAPATGRVTIDGLDPANLEGSSFRGQIAWFGGEPAFFAGPLRDVLVLDDDSRPLAEVLALCTEVGLSEVVEALPLRWNTELGADGSPLPERGRRLLEVAQARLREPTVVIWDDTSTPWQCLEPEEVGRLLGGFGGTRLVLTRRPEVARLAERINSQNTPLP